MRLAQWAQVLSPYQLNPLDLNPLRALRESMFNFARLCDRSAPRLYIAAMHAGRGRLRLFRDGDLSLHALLASTCPPNAHHAVDIDSEPYWDGGFAAVPACPTPCTTGIKGLILSR